MRDHTTPIRLEYVFGLRISFLHTMISIRRVITLAGGMCFPPDFLCSSAVDPSLSFSSSTSSSAPFTGNFNSSPPTPASKPPSI
uniref:Uncharacterized protein n=1 Tax=Cajanus cajan TaxID=3821 RepID=A0A151QVB3_CAJCA|nr:hypothetical protein KK1_044838 [Cajanus cajan]